MATRKGIIKKTPIEQFERVRSTGIRAITVAEDDELAWVAVSSGDDEVILASAMGKIGRFSETRSSADGPRRGRRHRHPPGQGKAIRSSAWASSSPATTSWS